MLDGTRVEKALVGLEASWGTQHLEGSCWGPLFSLCLENGFEGFHETQKGRLDERLGEEEQRLERFLRETKEEEEPGLEGVER